MSATDRADSGASLVRAPSHQPYSGDLEPLKSIRSHVSQRSQHAHFDLPEDNEEPHAPSPPPPAFDIEHVPVDDDPREWSNRKKNLVMALMTAAVVSEFGIHLEVG